MAKLYVVARNPSGRPTLMHRLAKGDFSKTLCGRDVSRWSRAFMGRRIDEILCKHPRCRA